MTVARYFRHRGHRINVDTRSYATTYEDGTPLGDEERPCSACGLCATGQLAPDPCLGFLADVRAACCGHGRLHSAYVSRIGRGVLTGLQAAAWLTAAGGYPAPLAPDSDPTIGAQLQLRTMAWMAQLHGTMGRFTETMREAVRAMTR